MSSIQHIQSCFYQHISHQMEYVSCISRNLSLRLICQLQDYNIAEHHPALLAAILGLQGQIWFWSNFMFQPALLACQGDNCLFVITIHVIPSTKWWKLLFVQHISFITADSTVWKFQDSWLAEAARYALEYLLELYLACFCCSSLLLAAVQYAADHEVWCSNGCSRGKSFLNALSQIDSDLADDINSLHVIPTERRSPTCDRQCRINPSGDRGPRLIRLCWCGTHSVVITKASISQNNPYSSVKSSSFKEHPPQLLHWVNHLLGDP